MYIIIFCIHNVIVTIKKKLDLFYAIAYTIDLFTPFHGKLVTTQMSITIIYEMMI